MNVHTRKYSTKIWGFTIDAFTIDANILFLSRILELRFDTNMVHMTVD